MLKRPTNRSLTTRAPRTRVLLATSTAAVLGLLGGCGSGNGSSSSQAVHGSSGGGTQSATSSSPSSSATSSSATSSSATSSSSTSSSSTSSSSTSSSSTSSSSTSSSSTSSSSTKGGIGSLTRSGTAPLKIANNSGQTLALAPVVINGHGPLLFIVDTGASRSTIDRSVARQIGLSSSSQSVSVSGVGCQTQAGTTTVSSWRVGNVALPTDTLDVVNLGGANSSAGIQGLLGSDVLSDFGIAAIDYQNGVLRLGSGAVSLSSSTAKSVQLQVEQHNGAVLAVAPVTVSSHGPYPFIVDSGAATSSIVSDLVGTLGLPVVSSGQQVSGVACTSSVKTVRVSNWSVGSVSLPGGTLTTINPPGGGSSSAASSSAASSAAASSAGPGIAGLLGSDRLSNFGTMAIDYANQKLWLASRS